MTTTAAPATAPTRITSLGDLVASVPYLVGFVPRRSLVVLGAGSASSARRAVGLVQRADLPESAQDVALVVGAVVDNVRASGARSAYAVVVGDESGMEDREVVEAVVAECRERFEAAGVTLSSLCEHRGDLAWERLQDRRGRRAPAIRVPAPADSVPVSDLVLQGRAPLPDREAVTRLVEGPPATPVRELLRAALDARLEASALAGASTGEHAATGGSAGVGGAAADAVWARLLDLADPTEPEERVRSLTTSELGDVVVSLLDRDWRDALIGAIRPALGFRGVRPDTIERVARVVEPSGSGESRHDLDHGTRVLLALCRRIPDPHACDLLAAVGAVRWADGDGIIAGAALERSLAADPGHRLSALCHQLVSHAIKITGDRRSHVA